MSFEVIWDTKCLKILDKLPKEESKRIVNEAKENPKRYAERLVGIEVYKIRVGNYRVKDLKFPLLHKYTLNLRI